MGLNAERNTDLLALVWRYRVLVLACIVLGLGVSTWFNFTRKPAYKFSQKIRVGSYPLLNIEGIKIRDNYLDNPESLAQVLSGVARERAQGTPIRVVKVAFVRPDIIDLEFISLNKDEVRSFGTKFVLKLQERSKLILEERLALYKQIRDASSRKLLALNRGLKNLNQKLNSWSVHALDFRFQSKHALLRFDAEIASMQTAPIVIGKGRVTKIAAGFAKKMFGVLAGLIFGFGTGILAVLSINFCSETLLRIRGMEQLKESSA